jgi:hypothetical protein
MTVFFMHLGKLPGDADTGGRCQHHEIPEAGLQTVR